MQTQPLLSLLLAVDALLALGFGAASWLAPLDTYGTIVDVNPPGAHQATLAALTSLSMGYLFVGAVCAFAVVLPAAHRSRFAGIMLLWHAAAWGKGYSELGASWLVGDPIPDLVIHGVFASLYVATFFGPRMR